MGGNQSLVYSVPFTQKVAGETSIYRNPDFKDSLHSTPSANLITLKDVFNNCLSKYGNLPALGTIVKKENTTEVDYITYKSAIQTAHAIGSAIVNLKLYHQNEGQKLKMIGIYSKNRAEWTITDIAACLFGFTTIPLYDTLGNENITYVFKHTTITTVFVDKGSVNALLNCDDLVTIRRIISFDKIQPFQVEAFKEKGVQLLSFNDIIDIGKTKLVDYHSEEFKVQAEDCITFSYTSGTTGPPKGAMLSHKNFVSFLAAEVRNKDTKFSSNDVILSYLPLPHILERQAVYSLLHVGARVVYYSGDVQKLKDDLAVVKPTIFISVPRLFSRFYEVLKGKFEEVTGMTRKALFYALETKLATLKSTGVYTHQVYDRIFFAKTREALGGRVRLMVSGSAPLLPQVQNFLKVCMCAPLIEGYGQTESTGAMSITAARDPDVKHVGGPLANFEIKLVDIPEMSYLSTDKDEEGQAYPRGQLWTRGPGVFLGYYHDQAKTKQAISDDGWLKTGDVAALNPKTKAMSIIDRKKNIFKLQQGEYVAAEKVQNTYMKGEKLAELYIHGESTQTFVIAIAVPHKKAVESFASTLKIQGSYEQLCKNTAIRSEFVNYLNAIGKQAGLQGFQQAKNIYLDTETFLSRGILTNTMKIQRHEAKKLYKNEITAMYKEGILKSEKK